MIDFPGLPSNAAAQPPLGARKAPSTSGTLTKDTLPSEPVKAAEEMEGYFASMLVSELRKGLAGGSWFGEGAGSDVYDGLFDQMLGNALAEGRGIGLKDGIAAQLAEHAARPNTAVPTTEPTP